MPTQVTDVLDAVQSFVAKGYDREYRVKDGALVDRCRRIGRTFSRAVR